jgi:hypothetical protein
MIVLLDLEWIEQQGENHLTQLSVLRADADWQETSHLNLIVKPSASCMSDMRHVALGGYVREIFDGGLSEEECLLTVQSWLCPEDIVWVWAESNRRYWEALWKKYLPDLDAPPCYGAAKKACALACHGQKQLTSPYVLLRRRKVEPLYPEHRSANDVEAMREVLEAVKMPLDAPNLRKKPAVPPQLTPPKPPLPQRELNRKVIEATEYNYIYLDGSQIFHRRDCKVCLRAKSSGSIRGSVYFETASNGRRPCKICQPQEGLALAPKSLQRLAKERNKRFVRVTLLTGETAVVKYGNILGWCNCGQHPGAITKGLLKAHDCLGKQCFHLRRNVQSPFWAQREAARKTEEKRKARLQEERERRSSQETALQLLADDWQDYLDEIDSDMYIVRVVKDTPSQYRIFYVSDNSFADGNRYPELVGAIRSRYPRMRVVLRHIRDVDGHFVTKDEYFARQRLRKA